MALRFVMRRARAGVFLRRAFGFVFATTFVLAAMPLALAQAPAASSDSVLFLSDIHFDPFADIGVARALAAAPVRDWHAIFTRRTSAPSTYFGDTNFALLEAALTAAQRSRPPLVVIAGDFLAHDFDGRYATALPAGTHADYEAFVDKTIAFLAREFDAAFPAAAFVIALGNNDGYCGDYRSTPGSPFLARMARAWEPLVDRAGRAPEFVRDFSAGGYYAMRLPGSASGQAIVLNSVVWSKTYANACGDAASDPGAAEIDWLSRRMAGKPATYRWFVTHIPPGIDAYSSFRKNAPVPFMDVRYERRLVATVDAAEPRAALFVLGHVHHASFSIIGPGDGSGIPGLIVPSLSPVQGNNPAFLRAHVDDDGHIARTAELVYAGGVWTSQPAFADAAASGSFDLAALELLHARLGVDPALRAEYAASYNAQSPVAAVIPSTWAWYWCAETALEAEAYASCLESAAGRTPTPAAPPAIHP